MSKLCLIDMDNTLFDYEGRMYEELRKIASPFDPPLPTNLWADDIPWLKARMDMIKSVPGWWRTLPVMQSGFELYEAAKSIGFKCLIFTKGPRSKSLAWAEKIECIDVHFGREMDIDIVSDKGGRYGRVLIDDYPNYALSWLEHRPRGLVVMPERSCNTGFSHPNVVKYTGDNLPEVLRAMRIAYGRAESEPLSI